LPRGEEARKGLDGLHDQERSYVGPLTPSHSPLMGGVDDSHDPDANASLSEARGFLAHENEGPGSGSSGGVDAVPILSVVDLYKLG